MIVSYFKTGWRNLLRNKAYSVINITGLALGIAVAMLIGLWAYDELTHNSFPKSARIAEVYHNLEFGDQIYTHDAVPYPFGDELRNNYPEFDQVVVASEQEGHIVRYGEATLLKTGLFVEPEFMDLFSVKVVEGSGALTDVHSVVLSQSCAVSIVGDNPVGKMIKFDNRENLLIAGVFEDFPTNSEFSEIEMLLPMSYYFTMDETKRQLDNWEDYSFQCFVLLSNGTTFEKAGSRISKLVYEKGTEAIRSMKPEGLLFPMTDWHLYSEFKDGKNVGGKIQVVWMFGMVGIFELLLACINFINLSTARSAKRSREVGIRKVMGSMRKQLVSQFFSESFLVVILSFFLAVGIVVAGLPLFNDLAGKQMSLPWTSPAFSFVSVLFIVVTALLAGGYPALYLSSFNPVKVLKGAFETGSRALLPRKVLVVFQFTISITLILGTIIVFQQIQYGKDRSVGFDRKGIIHIEVRTEDLANADYNSLRNTLLSTGVVENMAKSDFPITGGSSADLTLTWEGKDTGSSPLIAMNSCSHDFPVTNGFRFIEGRDFSRDFSSDSMAMIVNESMAKVLSSGSVIGKTITTGSGKLRKIIGVIEDQIRWTPFSTQTPHIYYLQYQQTGYLTVRMKPEVGVRSALGKIETVLKSFDPGAPFDYKFLDDDYARLFQDEELVGKIAGGFAVLAIFISCLGIFGLASFAASQRTREIGIRKVLGASIFNVWQMLSQEFALLVVVSIVIASPLAFFLGNQWLQRYDYRVEIAWWYFVATAAGALIITLITVSYQSIKAAAANPVSSLRSE